MAIMNVSLPDLMKTWVDQRAQSGHFSDASDYVRDLIRKDQERVAGIDELQQLITQGVASGPAQDFNVDQFLKTTHTTYAGR